MYIWPELLAEFRVFGQSLDSGIAAEIYIV